MAGAGNDDVPIKDGAANHFKGMESVGGRLYLTNRRLIFRSHSLNIQTHEESYRLDDIVAIVRRNTLGIVPNGIAVRLVDGREERFVVNGRGDWISKIESARAEAHDRPSL